MEPIQDSMLEFVTVGIAFLGHGEGFLDIDGGVILPSPPSIQDLSILFLALSGRDELNPDHIVHKGEGELLRERIKRACHLRHVHNHKTIGWEAVPYFEAGGSALVSLGLMMTPITRA
jgi:hypothetical protein